MLRRPYWTLLALLPVFGIGRLVAQASQVKPIDPTNLDTTCAPCRDFYRFANGGWLDRNTIPSDRSRWGAFDELLDRNYASLKEVLEAAAAAGSAADPNTRKLGTYYAGCMDSVQADRDGVKPLEPDLKRIGKIRSRADLVTAWAWVQQREVGAPFILHSTPDAKNSSRVIAEIYQGGLGLPDRDYYTREDSASEALRAKYTAHLRRTLQLLGEDSASAARATGAIMGLETALAKGSLTRVEQRNPEKRYHLTPIADLQSLAPNIPWKQFFQAVGQKDLAELNLAQPDFIRALDTLVAKVPLDHWTSYLRWHLASSRAAVMDAALANEDFDFRLRTLRGVGAMEPRWKRCVAQADTGLGGILGQAYVARNFTPETKGRALEMVHNIQEEFRTRLERASWMTDETKTRAITKLDAIVNKIGYPDQWRDYGALRIEAGPFVANVDRAAAFDYAYDLSKIGKPVDRSEWGMTPPTVNAYYNPLHNEIVFPAGILQPPFYDPEADDAVNYGGMGAVIGHEITHGFDDEGRQFDAQGNLSGWWTPEDAQGFTARADVVARQFDGYVAVDTLHVNGKLTLGENLADLGGLSIAYGAYRRSLAGKPEPTPIDGLSGSQRFFLAWAQVWRRLERPERTRLQVLTDPHSPAPFRVNGPLSNLAEFAQAFGCHAGDAMVRSGEERAEVW
jgi:putative endopeptidase